MWQMFVGAGLMAILGNGTAKAQAEIDTRLSAVNAAATNQVTRARNIEGMARNSLNRYVQSVNNNRMLDDGGDAFTSNLVNGLRAMDSDVNRKLLEDVQTIEEFGASVATQAGTGASGQVVDMINSTTALRASISRELAQQSSDSARYDVSTRSQSIMSQMVGGLDGSLIIDGIDTRQAVAQKAWAPTNGQAVFSAVLQTAMKAGAGNVAEWGAQALGSLASKAGEAFSSGNSGAAPMSKFSFNPNVRFGS